MGKFRDFLAEKLGVKYSYGCIMADVPRWLNIPSLEDESVSGFSNPYEKFVHKYVKKGDLYFDKDGSKGIESQQHITVLYGTLPANDENDLVTLKRIAKTIAPFYVTMGKVEKFKQDIYDVLKISIVPNSNLTSLHSVIKNTIENVYEFPSYEPHITLAYVKSGTCEDLIGNDTFEGIQIQIERLDFSMSDGSLKSIYIPYTKVFVNNLFAEEVINIVVEEPSTAAPTSVADGQRPTRGKVISRKGKTKRFKDGYSGGRFIGYVFDKKDPDDDNDGDGGSDSSG